MYLTRDITEATYCIEHNGITGTAFAADVDGQLCFITARHLFHKTPLSDSKNEHAECFTSTIAICNGIGVKPSFDAKIYSDERYDCALVVPTTLNDDDVFHTMPINALSSIGLTIGSDVLLVGFPFIWANGGNHSTENPDKSYPYYIPIIKSGIVSTFESVDGKYMLIDAHNNKGFSGGPVVWKNPQGKTCVIGVINGFYCDKFDSGIDKNSNSGFTEICPISKAVDLIKKHIPFAKNGGRHNEQK